MTKKTRGFSVWMVEETLTSRRHLFFTTMRRKATSFRVVMSGAFFVAL